MGVQQGGYGKSWVCVVDRGGCGVMDGLGVWCWVVVWDGVGGWVIFGNGYVCRIVVVWCGVESMSGVVVDWGGVRSGRVRVAWDEGVRWMRVG